MFKLIQNTATKLEKRTDDGNTIRIVLPFKDQIAGNAVLLSNNIAVTLKPIFVSKILEQDLKPKEIKSSIVSQHCIVHTFACDLCDADYVGFTAWHHIAEPKHLLEDGDKNLLNEGQFRVLKKSHGKFDRFVYEMIFIKEQRPKI